MYAAYGINSTHGANHAAIGELHNVGRPSYSGTVRPKGRRLFADSGAEDASFIERPKMNRFGHCRMGSCPVAITHIKHVDQPVTAPNTMVERRAERTLPAASVYRYVPSGRVSKHDILIGRRQWSSRQWSSRQWSSHPLLRPECIRGACISIDPCGSRKRG
jgi:hypothetical protein